MRGEIATADKIKKKTHTWRLETLAGELEARRGQQCDAAKRGTLAGARKWLAGTTT